MLSTKLNGPCITCLDIWNLDLTEKGFKMTENTFIFSHLASYCPYLKYIQFG